MTTFYCGRCGNECTPTVTRRRFMDEAYGAPKMFTEVTFISDCCGDEFIYTDPEMTMEATDKELEEACGIE